jgi:NAD(P)-dependent dehydrogenase (short-subunit alcohol dehydrogenase family)
MRANESAMWLDGKGVTVTGAARGIGAAIVEACAREGARVVARVGRLSGRDLLAAWVAHDRIRFAQLADTMARLWALRWPELRTDYAGPIPYSD